MVSVVLDGDIVTLLYEVVGLGEGHASLSSFITCWTCTEGLPMGRGLEGREFVWKGDFLLGTGELRPEEGDADSEILTGAGEFGNEILPEAGESGKETLTGAEELDKETPPGAGDVEFRIEGPGFLDCICLSLTFFVEDKSSREGRLPDVPTLTFTLVRRIIPGVPLVAVEPEA